MRAGPGARRDIHLVLENDRNESRYLNTRRTDGRAITTQQWDDDFHHAFHVELTGEERRLLPAITQAIRRRCAWRCLAEGFAYQAETSPFRDGEVRGEPSAELPPPPSLRSSRITTRSATARSASAWSRSRAPNALRAAIRRVGCSRPHADAFMGEEFGAASPFFFFATSARSSPKSGDDRSPTNSHVCLGFSSQAEHQIPDPNHPATFERSKLEWPKLDEPRTLRWLDLITLLASREHIVPQLGHMRGHAGRFSVITRRAHGASALGDGNGAQLRL